MDPLDIIASVADAAFATDEGGRIVIWNRAAARLLGRDPAQVLGRPCHEMLCGYDVFGNRFCNECCSITQMARRQEAVHHFEMDVARASGERVRSSFSIIVVPGPRPSQFTIIHLLRPVERGRETNELIHRLLAASPSPELPPSAAPASPGGRPAPLTAREIEILRLMADGSSTSHIADSLFISRATVRNHTQNILRKLEVHSKLEAVSLALRTRLI